MEKLVGRKIKFEKLKGSIPTGDPNDVKVGIPHVEPTQGIKFLLLTESGYFETPHEIFGVGRNTVHLTSGAIWRVTLLT